ncbi:50S ribosomal protein L3 [Candidatus Uhrbacteria bacterium]|nr:50S ribosomal protein L3 [Candidatus Uhrbacteria bacterium]
MKFILGVKLDMTQGFDSAGRVHSITRVQAGPCTVTQVKTNEKDGYAAVQVGYGRKKNVSRAQAQALRGITRVKETDGFRHMKEFRVDKVDAVERGDRVTVNVFSPGDRVHVIGTSKGKGFAGVVKRHGFHGHPSTHGHKDQARMPGAIGAGGVQHVLKGKRMGGRMGGMQSSVKNLEVVSVDSDLGVLSLRGSVPGARNSLIIVQGEGEAVFEKSSMAQSPAQSEHQEQEQLSQEVTADTSNPDGAQEETSAEPEPTVLEQADTAEEKN